MTAKYIDLTDVCPISTTTGNVQNLPDSVWSGVFRQWNRFSAGSYHTHRIDAGEISERKLKLGTSNSSVQTQYLPITNNLDKHFASMGLKWNNNDDQNWNNNTTDRYMPVIGWNAACTRLTVDSKAATDLISISGDGKVRCNGVESDPNSIPVNTYVYFEVTIDPADGSVNVSVNKTPLVNAIIPGLTSLDQLGIVCNTGGSDGATNYFLHIDDLCICDETGTAPFNNLFDDYISFKRLPLLAATETNFMPQGAASNILAVNKQDLSTNSFNRSGSENDVGDFYSLDTSVLDGTETILGVAITGFCRKTDLGDRSLDLSMKATIGGNPFEANQPFDGLDPTFKGPITPFIKANMPDNVTPITIANLADLRVGYIVRGA